MKSLTLLINFCQCVQFEKFYPPKQLFIYDKQWEDKAPYKDYVKKLHHRGNITKALDLLKKEVEDTNVQWVKDVKREFHREKYVDFMVNLHNTLVITPNTIGTIDADDFCWVLFVYNSHDWRHQRVANSLLNAVNEQFYERCGVATVDISYPGNNLGLVDSIMRIRWYAINIHFYFSKNQTPVD